MYKLEGRIGTYTGHPIEVVNLKPDDAIILHLTENVDYESANILIKDIQKIFPNNPIIYSHPPLIENITIMRVEEKDNFTWHCEGRPKI